MADLSFLDKLTPQQAEIAEKVAQEAIKRGINPRFAVALAYTENGFMDRPGSVDEIGIMQVRPGTARQYGYDPKELKDPDRNIQIGLDILKRHLTMYENDPYAAAVAYNAGPDQAVLLGKENATLPAITREYLKNIRKLGGFTEAPPKEEPPQKSEELQQQERLAGLTSEERMQEMLSDPELKKRVMADLAGAGAGAVIGKGLDVGSDLAQMMRDRRDVLAAQAAAVRAGPGAPPAPIPTDPMHTRQMQGTTEAGTTGRARQQTYNVGTSQQSSAAKQQADVIEQLKRQGLVSGDARSVMAKAPGLTATPSGVLLPSSQVYADIPPPQGTTPPPKPNLMQRTGQATRNMVGALGRGTTAPFRSPVVSGALGGLGAVESGAKAMEYGAQGKAPEAGMAAAGALGGLAAMLPFPPPVKAAGAAASVVSPLSLYLYEKAKARKAEQQGLEQMGMYQEAMPSIYRPRYQ